MIEAKAVSFAYGETPVLNGVSLKVVEGQTLGLLGPNGSGKTTLLRQLHGSLTPSSGTVTLAGCDIRTYPPHKIAQKIAIVVQEPPGDLNHTVADTVLMGRIPHQKAFQRQSVRDEQLAVNALRKVNALHLAQRGLAELSGGERQRVLMARALAQEAHCLLLDEPTNHLDIGFQHQLLEMVQKLQLTTVAVLHDLNLAARYCDTVALLDQGKIQSIGSPKAVLTSESISAIYGIDVEIVDAHDGVRQLLFHRNG